MKYINEKGLAYIKIKIAQIINKLQSDLAGIILYENKDGLTKGMATLNDSLSNYKKFKVVYGLIDKNERKIYEAEVLSSNHIHLQSEIIDTASRLFIIRYADLTITGTNVAINCNSYVNINHNASPYIGNPSTVSNYIAIYKIIGYKEE